jgi:hypothetical protein
MTPDYCICIFCPKTQVVFVVTTVHSGENAKQVTDDAGDDGVGPSCSEP